MWICGEPVTALLPSAFVAALSMASVWRDVHAFVRDGGPSDAVIARAHDAVSNGEPCACRAEDHVMGIDEDGMLAQGVVLPESSGSDGFLVVACRNWSSVARFLVCTASAMPMLVVNIECVASIPHRHACACHTCACTAEPVESRSIGPCWCNISHIERSPQLVDTAEKEVLV